MRSDNEHITLGSRASKQSTMSSELRKDDIGRRTFLQGSAIGAGGFLALLPIAANGSVTRRRHMKGAQVGVPLYAVGVNGDGELEATCSGGTMECVGGDLATAAVTSIHDETLRDATLQINQILKGVAERRDDRALMLFNVGGEILLCWAAHDPLPSGFRPVEDINVLRRILGVK